MQAKQARARHRGRHGQGPVRAGNRGVLRRPGPRPDPDPPARKDEKQPRPFPNWLRQRVEAVIWTLKNQLGLERHGGRLPTPLPIRPRPVSGETTFSYIRRLAVANHMRPLHLRRYLKDPGPGGGFRLGWLAALAGRPVISLQHALADQEPPAGTAARRPPDSRQRKRSKAELFTLIRRDAREHGLSARALADKHGTSKRIVRQALRSPRPDPRKPQPLRGSRLDPFTAIIDGKLQAEMQAFPPQRQPVISIYRELVTRHGADEVSYQMVRKYVGRRRAVMHHQTLSPAHQAVADHDLNRLRDLLDNRHDIENDNGDGWSLLRRAIHAEADRHTRTGEPLHADTTAFLLARGARPHEDGTGTATEAELLGHWLAAEIVSAWPDHRHLEVVLTAEPGPFGEVVRMTVNGTRICVR